MSVQRYHKKPVEVEGLLYTGSNDDEMAMFAAGQFHYNDDTRLDIWQPSTGRYAAQVWNASQNAWNVVNPGDTVLRGLVGEYYPCSPDALAATYDEMAQPAPQEPRVFHDGDEWPEGGHGGAPDDLWVVTAPAAPRFEWGERCYPHCDAPIEGWWWVNRPGGPVCWSHFRNFLEEYGPLTEVLSEVSDTTKEA